MVYKQTENNLIFNHLYVKIQTLYESVCRSLLSNGKIGYFQVFFTQK